MAKNNNTDIKTTNSWVQFIWITVLLSIIAVGLIFLIISKFMLPDTAELENPKYDLATQIISIDGKQLGKAFKTNREWLRYEEINPNLIHALVATEDERFFSHSGIDFRGTARAVIFMGSKGGASTITQQLAKLFFTNRSSTFIKRVWQKLKEWVIAVEFEKRYTKEEILAMYLNKNDFIYESIGVATAAKTYFGKDQSKLTVDEAAVIVGMLKNPVYYNPKINPERSAQRKRIVLKQMLKNGYIKESEFKKYIGKPLNIVNFKREVYYDGPAPYFRAELVKWTKNLLAQPKYSKPDGTKYDIYTDGLKIYTTIDSKIQAHAEKAMQDHMANLQKRFFAVWATTDPWKSNGNKPASKEELTQRAGWLQTDIRNSERFKSLRAQYLGKITNAIVDEIPKARILDSDIFRLFDAEKDSKYLKNGIKKGYFTAEQADTYERILRSKYWKDLKGRWNALKSATDKSFAQKVNMTIYDYSTGGEKNVTMTPLDSIKYLQQIMQMGTIVADSKTGEVKAWVGGVNHKYFQYDHVTADRQVGSTFKPFIYATAIIDQALSPCSKFQDVQTCIQANDPNFNILSTWCPANSTGKYSGEWLNLRRALEKSTNTVSVQLMKEIGSTARIKEFVQDLGIDIKKIPDQPSICLGTPGLSVLDMATAYTAFANNGTLSKPIFVTRIEDKNGRIIYNGVPEQKKAIPPSFNYVITDLLQSVASAIQPNFSSPVAGKTGTTNDYKDGWFVGFTPELVIATWVGGDKEFIRFTTLADGAGSAMARPMFISLLKKIEADPSMQYGVTSQFEVPEEQIVELDCSKYEAILNGGEAPVPANNTEGVIEEEFDENF